MKKLYSIICVFMFFSSAFAQTTNLELTKKDFRSVSKATTNSISTISNSNSAATVIWSDDCSDITTWTLSNTSIPPIDWSLEMDPAAIPVTALSPFNSTTASNGYLFINSDGTGGGDGDGTPVECTATSPMIDLTGWPYVQLTFSHNYRWWQDTRSVRVSADGGNTWTQFDMTDANGYPNNQNSNNPQNEVINISSIAGDQDSVMVQFYYFDNDYWAWYWAVDDVSIEEMPDNAITSSNEVIGGYWVDYLNYPALGPNTMIGLDYTHSPITQLTNHPYSFEAFIKNDGVATQHTVLKYDVTGPSTASGTSPVIVLDTQEDSIFVATPPFGDANTPIGSYKVDIWGEADSAGAGIVTTMTDIYSKDIDITDYIYAKDLGEDSIYGRYILCQKCICY